MEPHTQLLLNQFLKCYQTIKKGSLTTETAKMISCPFIMRTHVALILRPAFKQSDALPQLSIK